MEATPVTTFFLLLWVVEIESLENEIERIGFAPFAAFMIANQGIISVL